MEQHDPSDVADAAFTRALLESLSTGTRMSNALPAADDEDLNEEDLDQLLQWSDALDFEAYHADWLGVATSARPEWNASVSLRSQVA